MQFEPCGRPSSCAFVKRFHDHRDRARSRELLDAQKLVGRADLPGGDDVLDLGHDHRDDGQRLGEAGDSPIMPTFITCASIWPKPAMRP
jgi:hypothetical protein